MAFYSTTAQVIPILLLALIWESGYLERLKREDRSGSRFWKKPRVRAWVIFMSGAAVVGEGATILVLADWVSSGSAAKALVVAALAAVLGSLVVRLVVDILTATKDDVVAISHGSGSSDQAG